MHRHEDIEIFMFPFSGVVEHQGYLGNRKLIHSGSEQKITVGSGILHSHINASSSEADHHLQVWLNPRALGEKLTRDMANLVSPEGGDGNLLVYQVANEKFFLRRSGGLIRCACVMSARFLRGPT